MKADAQTKAAMVGMLDSFCSAFQARDVEAVMRLFASDPDVVVVTSEEPLLRGPDELQDFLRAYVGAETAATQTAEQTHPYRMTMACEKRDEHWLLVQVHGSSPHRAAEG